MRVRACVCACVRVRVFVRFCVSPFLMYFAGANTGIGLETAVDLASRGGRVIMACRSLDRGNAALLQVKNRANTNNVNLMQLGQTLFTL